MSENEVALWCRMLKLFGWWWMTSSQITLSLPIDGENMFCRWTLNNWTSFMHLKKYFHALERDKVPFFVKNFIPFKCDTLPLTCVCVWMHFAKLLLKAFNKCLTLILVIKENYVRIHIRWDYVYLAQ